uniref:Uncharacterized protein n=2 Tax=Setaria viridis TaxID=4556 RepID=A0A4U6U901_SETVI|nr:hypothetical protein SEVIR_6G210066v2 [Setaria viridis]
MANVLIEEIAGDEQVLSHTSAMKNLAEFKIFWSVLRAQVLEDDDAGTPRRPTRRVRWRPLLRSVNDWMAMFETSLLLLRQQHGSSSSAVPKWTASLHSVVWAVLAELDAWPDIHEMVGDTLEVHATAVGARDGGHCACAERREGAEPEHPLDHQAQGRFSSSRRGGTWPWRCCRNPSPAETRHRRTRCSSFEVALRLIRVHCSRDARGSSRCGSGSGVQARASRRPWRGERVVLLGVPGPVQPLPCSLLTVSA